MNPRFRFATARGRLGSLRRHAVAIGLLAGAVGASAPLAPAVHASTDPAEADTKPFEHAYGTTEIPVDPQRVVTLGWVDVEHALTLGVTPVGFRDWFGSGLNPWAAELVTGDQPERVDADDGDYRYEYIAALEPDLIFVNAYEGDPIFTEAMYDKLSEIAPTVGPIPEEDETWTGEGVIPVVQDDRIVWMPGEVADALTFGTAISIEAVLETLPDLIAEKLPPADT